MANGGIGDAEARFARDVVDAVLDMNQGDLEAVELLFEEQEGIEVDEDADGSAFEAWVTSHAVDAMRGRESRLPDPFTAWRAIVARSDWSPRRDGHPGDHWATDTGNALAYHGDAAPGMAEIVVEAEIPHSSVDWVLTAVAALAADENEVVVDRGAPIKYVAWGPRASPGDAPARRP